MPPQKIYCVDVEHTTCTRHHLYTAESPAKGKRTRIRNHNYNAEIKIYVLEDGAWTDLDAPEPKDVKEIKKEIKYLPDWYI